MKMHNLKKFAKPVLKKILILSLVFSFVFNNNIFNNYWGSGVLVAAADGDGWTSGSEEPDRATECTVVNNLDAHEVKVKFMHDKTEKTSDDFKFEVKNKDNDDSIEVRDDVTVTYAIPDGWDLSGDITYDGIKSGDATHKENEIKFKMPDNGVTVTIPVEPVNYKVTVKYIWPKDLTEPDERVPVDKNVGNGITIEKAIPDGWVLNGSITYEGINSDGASYNEEDNKITFTMPAANVTVTIPLTKEYKVTFDANGGTKPKEALDYKQTVKYKEKAKVPSLNPIPPTNEGQTFEFAGWGTSKDATSTVDVATQELTKDTTFYAVYNDVSKYQVTFYKNYNATDDSTYRTYTSINTGTLWSTEIGNFSNPTREGYTFKGWSTTRDGKLATFPDRITGNLNYYAIWEPVNYSVTVKYSVPEDLDVPSYPGIGYKNVGNKIIIENAIPGGWVLKGSITYEGINSDGASYNEEDNKITFTMPAADVTVTIPLTKEYTIKYYKNDNTHINGQDQKVKFDDDISLLDGEEYRDIGKHFSGWNTQADGQGYSFGFTTMSTNAISYADKYNVIKLYLQQSDTPKYSVKYETGVNDSSVTGMPSGGFYSEGDNVAVSDQSPKRTGYEFQGWTVTEGGVDISKGTFKMPAKAVVLTAEWEPVEYSIVYHANDGRSPAQQVKKTCVGIDELKNYVLLAHDDSDLNFTKKNHKFTGWGLRADSQIVLGAGRPIIDFVEVSKDITEYVDSDNIFHVYAIWTKNGVTTEDKIVYSVTYDLAGGTAPQGVVYGASLMEGETVTRPSQDPIPPDDHEFSYWALTDAGPEYDFNRPVTNNIKLHAVYKRIGISVGESYEEQSTRYGESYSSFVFIDFEEEPETIPQEVQIHVRHLYYHNEQLNQTVHSDLDTITVPVIYDEDSKMAKIAVQDILDQTCADCHDEIFFENYRCVFDRNNDGYVSDDLIARSAKDPSIGTIVIDMEYYLNATEMAYYQIKHNYLNYLENTRYQVTDHKQVLSNNDRDDKITEKDIKIEDYIRNTYKGQEYRFKDYYMTYNEEERCFVIEINYELSDDVPVDVVDTGLFSDFGKYLVLVSIVTLGCWLVIKKTRFMKSK